MSRLVALCWNSFHKSSFCVVHFLKALICTILIKAFLCFSGISSLQIYPESDIHFFAIYCLFITFILLYLELKHKRFRPGYPVICLQNQAFIWCALRLENDQKFYDEFQAASRNKRMLCLWLMQSLAIGCAFFVHFFLRSLPIKSLFYQAVESIFTVVVSGFNVVTDIFKKILCMCRFKEIFVFVFAIVVVMALTKLFLVLGTLLFSYLCYLLLEALFGIVNLLWLIFKFLFNLIQIFPPKNPNLMDIFMFMFGKICLTLYYFLCFIFLLISIAYICLQNGYAKTFFFFLIAFIPFYCITSATLYILIFVLPFSVVKNIEFYIFGSLIIVGLRILCKRCN